MRIAWRPTVHHLDYRYEPEDSSSSNSEEQSSLVDAELQGYLDEASFNQLRNRWPSGEDESKGKANDEDWEASPLSDPSASASDKTSEGSGKDGGADGLDSWVGNMTIEVIEGICPGQAVDTA